MAKDKKEVKDETNDEILETVEETTEKVVEFVPPAKIIHSPRPDGVVIGRGHRMRTE